MTRDETRKRERFVALDSWRGISALMVALFHYPVAGAIAHAPLIRHSYLLVDFFFVLSGFVMMSTQLPGLSEPGGRVRYLVRRFAKLWPMHALVLAVFVAVSIVQGDLGSDERHSVDAIWTNLFLMQDLGLHSDLTWNGPSWSVGAEWLLYLVFALTAPLRRRNVVFVALAALGMATLLWWAPRGMASTFDYGFFRGLASFFTGALISQAPRRAFGSGVELGIASLVGVFLYLGYAPQLSPLLFGAVVYVFADSRGAISRLLRSPGLVAIGHWSYSIYIVHALLTAVLWAIARELAWPRSGVFLDGGALGDPIAIAYVIVLVAVASQTYRWIEEPLRQRIVAWAEKPLVRGLAA